MIHPTPYFSGFPHEAGIYISLSLPLKEWIQGRLKLSDGQLFTFQDLQDSPGDQGKGKVGLKKVLFFQKYNLFQG